MNRKKLQERLSALVTEAEALAAKDADGTISAEESARYDALLTTEIPNAKAALARADQLAEVRRTIPAVGSEEEENQAGAETVPARPKNGEQTPKFTSFGEQLQMIAKAGMNKGVPYSQIDQRLVYQAQGSGANEAVPSEGGFLVQHDFSTALLGLMHEMGTVMSRVRRVPIGAQFNGIKFPAIDETSRANGSRFGGVQAYWADEGDTVTASKPKFRQIELSLKKLMAIGYATDELLSDASALESILRQAFAEELVFKTEDAIINGTGAGQPLGILRSGALVTVTPASGQAANVVTAADILGMYARLPLRARRTAVWLINQDIEPLLWPLTVGSGVAVQMMYALPGSRSNDTEFGQLLGRPVLPIEYAATAGTVGDIILFDPQSYVMIDKNGVQQAASMHVRFLYDEMTFRFTFRLDGQPVWRSAVTPYKGSNTLSPYVVLGTRNS